MEYKGNSRMKWYSPAVRGCRWWAMVLLLSWAVMGPQAWAAGVDLRALENELMCYCDCYMVLSTCDCEEAIDMRQQITAMVEQGFDQEQMLAAFVEKYGETILAKPSGGGVNTLAWVLPFVALGVGGLFIALFLRRQLPVGEEPLPPSGGSGQQPSGRAATPAPPAGSGYDQELDEKIKKYL